MNDDPEYHLEDPGNNILLEKETSKRKKLVIIFGSIVIILVAVIIIGVVLYFTNKKDDTDNSKDSNKESSKDEKYPEYSLYYNITTSENNYIKNSFVRGGDNYIEEIGDLNKGANYKENERDNVDLCIPKGAMKNKKNYTSIMLNIHGGAWVGGVKEDAFDTCKYSSPYNIIVATMSYTLLCGSYEEYNIFRMIDEITAVIKTIKKFLMQLGFDENKLELFLSGGSAGAHLSLLYSYMIKNPPIPIKFIINYVGPVTLNPDYFLTTKQGEKPLKDIEPKSIEKALNDSEIIQMNGKETGVKTNRMALIEAMNCWLGNSRDYKIDEVFLNKEKMEINYESEIYKELLNKTGYAYPINYVTKESIPTLCLYGGKDEQIGIAQYAELKKAFNKHNNTNITLLYYSIGTHNIFDNATTNEEGRNFMANRTEEISNYCHKYLKSLK